MYANLSEAQREKVVREFRGARQVGCDVMQATAVAGRSLVASDRGWNGKAGSNAWAAALAVLAHDGAVEIGDSQ